MLTSYNNQISQKPSILDMVIRQGVSNAPLIAMLGTGTLTAPKHSWITDRYADAKDNANLEVSDLVETTTSTKQKTDNVAQIIKNEVGVSNREMRMSQYGQQEWQYQISKKAKEHAKDLEFALLGLGNKAVDAAPVVGTETVAPRMAGIFYYVSAANRYLPSGYKAGITTTYETITMDTLHNFLEPLWEKGGMDETSTFEVLCGSTIKRAIDTVAEKYIIRDSGTKKFDPTVTAIVTDFGTLNFRLHRQFSSAKLSNAMLAGQFKDSRIMYAQPTIFTEVPTSKTAKFGRFYTDATLEVKNGDMFASAFGLK